MMMRRSIWLTALLLVAVCAGCREGGPGTTGYVARAGVEKRRAVVLPFDSASLQFENAGQMVSQEVVTALLATGAFDVVDPGAVWQAMVDAGLRNGNGYGFGPAAMAKLQEKLGPVDVFVAGIVQEFGEVRVGPASYPSISINARVLDAKTGSILWSGSVSRTGADSEKLFGLGAVHSTGRLARAAVNDLVGSVRYQELAKVLDASATSTGGQPVAGGAHAVPSAPPRRTGKERYFDESAAYPEAAMRDLMGGLPGLTKGPVEYREHHFPIVETTYDGEASGTTVKLVDYRKVDVALGYLKHEHQDEEQGTFVGLPSYAGESPSNTPGAHHLDVAVGRFGLFLRCESGGQGDMERVARGLIDAMK